MRDVDALLEAQARCLEDPLGTVERLQRGEGLGELPEKQVGSSKVAKIDFFSDSHSWLLQVLAELPRIDWEKYSAVGVRAAAAGRKPETRNNKGAAAVNGGASASAAAHGETSASGEDRNTRGQILVRGRVFEEGKPRTFNQPWTAEEQQRLEELLVRFPSEDVEMERWKKVAAALGNRTAIQVQSRTQKYFLKLQKAGLPIPGRQLKARHRNNAPRPGTTRSGRQLVRSKNSAFFPALSPAVRMDEDDDDDEANPAPSSSFVSVFPDPLETDAAFGRTGGAQANPERRVLPGGGGRVGRGGRGRRA